MEASDFQCCKFFIPFSGTLNISGTFEQSGAKQNKLHFQSQPSKDVQKLLSKGRHKVGPTKMIYQQVKSASEEPRWLPYTGRVILGGNDRTLRV
jgi:hypothetical protein